MKANLILPNGTRWNAEFDGIGCILKHDENNLKDVMVALHLPRFTSIDIAFLKENRDIMKPIAIAIDTLQADDSFYGSLIPTIYAIHDELEQLLATCTYCEPLINVLHHHLRRRYDYLFDFNDERCATAIIATCSHPFFKMEWLPNENNTPGNIKLIQARGIMMMFMIYSVPLLQKLWHFCKVHAQTMKPIWIS